jgi:aspartate/methionine/tyrosine aminotransferase
MHPVSWRICKWANYSPQFAAIPSPLSEEDGYHIHPDKIAEEIARGTSVILTSNPRNPTGKVVKNPELAEIQNICRDRATLVMDEFYGGYNYTSNCDGTTISSAENIEDVDEDDVLIIDGLTKRFRLPGWRIAWIVGPKEFIKAIGSCGSYLDGGANVPFQEAAVAMLEPTKVRNEMKALQRHFMVRCPFSPPSPHPSPHKLNINKGQTRLRNLAPPRHGLHHQERARLHLLPLARPRKTSR